MHFWKAKLYLLILGARKRLPKSFIIILFAQAYNLFIHFSEFPLVYQLGAAILVELAAECASKASWDTTVTRNNTRFYWLVSGGVSAVIVLTCDQAPRGRA